MAQAVKNVLPSHLKNAVGADGSAGGSAERHHGKSQSHMVCESLAFGSFSFGALSLFPFPLLHCFTSLIRNGGVKLSLSLLKQAEKLPIVMVACCQVA